MLLMATLCSLLQNKQHKRIFLKERNVNRVQGTHDSGFFLRGRQQVEIGKGLGKWGFPGLPAFWKQRG